MKILFFLFMLSSCSVVHLSNTAPYLPDGAVLDKSNNLYSIHDNVKDSDTYRSVLARDYSYSKDVSLLPILVSHKKSKFLLADVSCSSDATIYFDRVILRCEKQKLITINLDSHERMAKRFNSSCDQYSCSNTEEATIAISKNVLQYIQKCTGTLYIQVEGDAYKKTSELNRTTDSNYFNGVASILKKFELL